jgi:hypothetical protein
MAALEKSAAIDAGKLMGPAFREVGEVGACFSAALAVTGDRGRPVPGLRGPAKVSRPANHHRGGAAGCERRRPPDRPLVPRRTARPTARLAAPTARLARPAVRRRATRRTPRAHRRPCQPLAEPLAVAVWALGPHSRARSRRYLGGLTAREVRLATRPEGSLWARGGLSALADMAVAAARHRLTGVA